MIAIQYEIAMKIAQAGEGVLVAVYYGKDGFLLCPDRRLGQYDDMSGWQYFPVDTYDEAINLIVGFRMGHIPDDFIPRAAYGGKPNDMFPELGRLEVRRKNYLSHLNHDRPRDPHNLLHKRWIASGLAREAHPRTKEDS